MRGDLNSKMSSINQAFHKGVRGRFGKAIDDIIMQAQEYELEARENTKVAQKETGRDK